jgi:hypothetical protein
VFLALTIFGEFVLVFGLEVVRGGNQFWTTSCFMLIFYWLSVVVRGIFVEKQHLLSCFCEVYRID